MFRRRFLPGIVASLAAIAFLIVGGTPHWLYDFDMAHMPGQASSQIVIVTIDTKTLNELGGYPLDRNYYTEILGKLTGAKVIGLDVNFVKPDPVNDATFAATVHSMGNVVLGGLFLPSELLPRDTTDVAQRMETYTVAEKHERGPLRLTLRPNSAAIQEQTSDVIAGANATVDEDFAIRKIPVAIESHGRRYLPFGPAVVRRYLGLPRGSALESGITTDWDDNLLINYRGHFPTFSFADVLHGKIPPGAFKDKIVLIGVSDGGAHDIAKTPVGIIPGTEIIAHEIDTILGKAYIRDEEPVGLLLILLLGFGGSWWLDGARPKLILMWIAVGLVLLGGGQFLLFTRGGRWVEVVNPSIALICSGLWIVQRRLNSC